VGGNFIAPVTDTIDTITWRTGSTASLVGTVTISICALDTNGYPLGTDISSTTRSSFASNTTYTETVSASVTRGSRYGVKIKVTSFTSGTLAILTNQGPFGLGSLFPFQSYNIASDTKNSSPTLIGVSYTTAGWIPTIGLHAPVTTNSYAIIATGNCCGNKFTVSRKERMVGYSAYLDADTAFEFALYQGDTPTEVSGSVASITSTPLFANAAAVWTQTPSVIELLPGITYRAVVRSLSATQITVNNFYTATANELKTFTNLNPGTCETVRTSGTWTDYSPTLAYVNVILEGGPTDEPWPTFVKGF
jgi:hypothetical protein